MPCHAAMALLVLVGVVVGCASASSDGASGTITVPRDRYEHMEKITATFAYTTTEDAEARATDFVGVYDANDQSKVLAIQPLRGRTSGDIDIRSPASGNVYIKLVRPPGFVLASTRVVHVAAPCVGNCTARGRCDHGVCICNPGFEGPSCEMLARRGAILSIFPHKSEHSDLTTFYQDTWIGVKISDKSGAPIKMNGQDFVGIYRNQSATGSTALQWRHVPRGLDYIAIPPPNEQGVYVIRLTRLSDFATISSSQAFEVKPWCKRSCSEHGVCSNGVCTCEPGYDLEDCSRGPDMANVTVLEPRHGEYTAKEPIKVRWWRNEYLADMFTSRDWIGLFDENSTNCDNPEHFEYTVAEPCADPDETDRRGNWTTGVVSFYGVRAGNYVAKYVRHDRRSIASSQPISIFVGCPDYNCSGHGYCNLGECHCQEGWTSADCGMGDTPFRLATRQYNTSGISVGTEVVVDVSRPVGGGKAYDFVGMYTVPTVAAPRVNYALGKNKTAEALGELMEWQYVRPKARSDNSGNAELAVVALRAPKQGEMQIRYVDGYTNEIKAYSKVFTVYPSCVGDCSGHGRCAFGHCVCEPGWEPPSCGRKFGAVSVTSPAHVTLVKDRGYLTAFASHVARPDGWFQTGDYVGLYHVGYKQDDVLPQGGLLITYQPISMDELEEELIFSLSPRTKPGMYELRYMRSGGEEVTATERFPITPDCTGGYFDMGDTNQCLCPPGFAGEFCDIELCCFTLTPSTYQPVYGQAITIDWTRPTNNGTEWDFIALYKSSDDVYSRPFDWAYARPDKGRINGGKVTLKFPPGIRGSFEARYVQLQRTYPTYAVRNATVVLNTTKPCLHDCSGHGDCYDGLCTCERGYLRSDCSKKVPTEIKLNATFTRLPDPDRLGIVNVDWVVPPTVYDVGVTPADVIQLFLRDDLNTNPQATAKPFIMLNATEPALGRVELNVTRVAVYDVRWMSAKSGEPLAKIGGIVASEP